MKFLFALQNQVLWAVELHTDDGYWNEVNIDVCLVDIWTTSLTLYMEVIFQTSLMNRKMFCPTKTKAFLMVWQIVCQKNWTVCKSNGNNNKY